MTAMRFIFMRCVASGLLLAACEETLDPASDAGTIVVTTSTGGSGSDADGFSLLVDGADARAIEPNGKVTLTGVAQGTHLLQLLGVAGNCSIDGSNPRQVEVGSGGRVEVTFAVICRPEVSGEFRITVSTGGTDLDEDGYGLSVAGAALRHIEINATETFSGLVPGLHLVTLKDVADNCVTVGGNPQPFTVVKDRTVLIHLQVLCGGGGPQ
jgi:hypothetical protein